MFLNDLKFYFDERSSKYYLLDSIYHAKVGDKILTTNIPIQTISGIDKNNGTTPGYEWLIFVDENQCQYKPIEIHGVIIAERSNTNIFNLVEENHTTFGLSYTFNDEIYNYKNIKLSQSISSLELMYKKKILHKVHFEALLEELISVSNELYNVNILDIPTILPALDNEVIFIFHKLNLYIVYQESEENICSFFYYEASNKKNVKIFTHLSYKNIKSFTKSFI